MLGGSKTMGGDHILMLYIKCHEAMAITITISPYNTTQILNDISLCVFITYDLFQTQIELEDFLWHGNWPWLLITTTGSPPSKSALL